MAECSGVARVRAQALRVGVLAVAATVGTTTLVVAVYYVLSGLVGALTELFEGRAWAARLSVGGGILAVVLVVLAIVDRRRERMELKRLAAKYSPDGPRR